MTDTAVHPGAAPRSTEAALQLADAVARGAAPVDALLAVLDENAPCYDGLGSDACERLRAVCFAALGRAGWSHSFDALVMEELRTSYEPIALAGAARAMAGCKSPPPGALASLVDAFERILPQDRRVDPSQFTPARDTGMAKTVSQELTTAFVAVAALQSADAALVQRMRGAAQRLKPSLAAEVTTQLDALVPAPSCCGGGGAAAAETRNQSFEISERWWQQAVQDQSGGSLSLTEALRGKPAFLTFFYTRCMNPMKCSATITRLAELQQRAAAVGLADAVHLAAMSYDPDYDNATRLKAYGADRGIGSGVRLLRMSQDSAGFFEALQVKVGYGPATVNRHGLDGFVLNASGRVVKSYARQVFDVDEVLADLQRALAAAP